MFICLPGKKLPKHKGQSGQANPASITLVAPPITTKAIKATTRWEESIASLNLTTFPEEDLSDEIDTKKLKYLYAR